MEIRGIVLLDYDGTVIDTMGIYAKWVGKRLKGLLSLSEREIEDIYLRTAGRPFIEQLYIMGLSEHIAREIADEFTKYKIEVLRELDVNDCVKSFVNALASKGFVVALSTNNECASIRISPSINVFHLVLCFDGLSHRKGSEHLRTLVWLFGEKTKVVFVGDTDYDVNVYSGLGLQAIKTEGLFKCDESDRILKTIEQIFSEK